MPTTGNRPPVAIPAPSANGHAQRRTLRVIAATADPDARTAFEKALTALGHQPVVTDTGGRLLDLCRAVPPDLVIADAKLPDTDGFELAAAVGLVVGAARFVVGAVIVEAFYVAFAGYVFLVFRVLLRVL